MSDYDDSNSGALFANTENWPIVQQGKINIDGESKRIIGVKRNNKDGKPIIELYTAIGTLKQNMDKREDSNDPDAKGVIENLTSSGAKRISAWKKVSKAGNNFTSLACQDFSGDTTQPTASDTPTPPDTMNDDDIPF
tara:strand:- start:1376 stop:1786 length:411 start_codon:yes stop_codon:yes gene_type:complete